VSTNLGIVFCFIKTLELRQKLWFRLCHWEQNKEWKFRIFLIYNFPIFWHINLFITMRKAHYVATNIKTIKYKR
jgi:hypothetical protein